MSRIAHISDLHFGKYFEPQVASHLATTIEQQQPDAIVVSGDLTQRAKDAEFAACKAFLQKLPDVPLLCVPGNHDIPLYNLLARLRDPLRGYQQYFGDAPGQLDLPDICVVGVDSTAPRHSFINGRVSSAELQQMQRSFAAADSDDWRVLVLHHHLLPPPGWDRRRPMPKATRLLDLLNELGVDVVLSGHLHRAYVGNTLDIYTGKAPSDGIIVVQCGTSTSRRGRGYEREKNSFNLIEFTAEHLHVAHWMYFAGKHNNQTGFRPVSRHQFTRPFHAAADSQ